MSGLQVTIFENHVRVPNGLGSFKNVSLQDFQKEIARVAAGMEQDGQPKQAFRLPNEAVCVRYNQHELDVLMYFPESKQTVTYDNKKYDIPFPATVILVKLKSNGKGGWTVESVLWLCTDYKIDEVPNLDNWEFSPRRYQNHLWILPFPNQYGNGGMCVGANSYRSLYNHDLRGLNELYYTILVASPFNNDLWHNAGNVINDPPHPRTWFNQLSRLEAFPWGRMRDYPNQTPVEVEEEEDDE